MPMRALVPFAAAAALTACATTPPVPAVTTIAGRACAVSVDLARATPLVPAKPEPRYSVRAVVDSSFPCVEIDGAKSTYVVFAFPPEATEKTFTVGGVFEEARIFAPIVQTLDANGSPLRKFSGDDFMARGELFSAQLRPRAEERYLLVRSAGGLVGSEDARITMGINTSGTYIPGAGAVTIRTGADNASLRTFSHEGIVEVQVADPRPPEGPAKKR
jgi:hypothetical protein